MSYVVPNGSIKILKDVPIERNYEHTLYFANAGAQYSYFNSKVKGSAYAFSDMSHIRVTTPGRKIRVPININNLYDCNYLIVQNNGNAGKIFYCFIDNVEYVNEGVSEISYSIDTIQTWLFEYSSGGTLNHQCFVERETVSDDTIGRHILSENFDTGDLLSGQSYTDPHFETTPKIVIMATANLNQLGLVNAEGTFLHGTYHQLDFRVITIPSSGDISQVVLDTITGLLNGLSLFDRENTVVNIIMMPGDFIPTPTLNWNGSRMAAQKTFLSPSWQPTLGTYTPKNNKLLTYPYTFFTVSNGEGTIKEFKYELFKNGISFYEYCDFSPEPSVALIPHGYNQVGLTGSTYHEFAEGLRFTNFPKCCYAINDLGAKFIQAGIGTAVAMGTAGLMSTGAHTTGNINFSSNLGARHGGSFNSFYGGGGRHESGETQLFGGEKSPGHYSGDTVITEKQFKAGATTAAGLVARALFGSKISSFPGNGNLNLVMGNFGFEFRQKFIRPEVAKMIDDYFSMYGYLVNVVKNPSIHNRTKWTYVKTSGCTVGGSIPNDDADEICNVFDNGITFWVNPSEVGNYNLTNGTLSYSAYTNENNNAETEETNPVSEEE